MPAGVRLACLSYSTKCGAPSQLTHCGLACAELLISPARVGIGSLVWLSALLHDGVDERPGDAVGCLVQGDQHLLPLLGAHGDGAHVAGLDVHRYGTKI